MRDEEWGSGSVGVEELESGTAPKMLIASAKRLEHYTKRPMLAREVAISCALIAIIYQSCERFAYYLLLP